MHAAVVHSFGQPPRYETFPTPAPAGDDDELLVEVAAAGLHPRVRSGADGSHYTSTDVLPLIPGVDGVGRASDGKLLYFVLPDTPLGSMAEQTVISRRRSAPLPEGVDPVLVAAAMNPAMSSWIALRKRIDFRPGQRVLVLGATGNAGRLAVQIAKHLGAGEVVAAARDDARLGTIGADATVSLNDDAEALGEAAADVDVVLDYLWGAVAERAIPAVVTHRRDRSRPLDWIQIGSVAGPTISLPSAALRAANLRLLGSGQGSVATAEIAAELPALAAEISEGAYAIDAVAQPLRDVETVWTDPESAGRRIVLVP